MTRQLKYVCGKLHQTFIDIPEVDKLRTTVKCPSCNQTSFFMSIVVLSEPDIDTDPTVVNRPWNLEIQNEQN